MPQPPSQTQTLQVVLDNYAQLLMFVTTVLASPTQSNIDAAVLQTNRMNLLGLRVTHSIGDENYSWTEYQQFIISQMETLRIQLQQSSGPFAFSTAQIPGYGPWGWR